MGISSSSAMHPSSVHLTAAVVRYDKPRAREHNGVCTSYMSRILPADGNTVRGYIRSSAFKLPADSSTPILMVAAGTGIAPFRAFVQQRLAELGRGCALGTALLYFG